MILSTTCLYTRPRPKDIVDTTIKSSSTPIGRLLAPTWNLVAGSKLYQAQHTEADEQIDLNDWFSGAVPLDWEQYTEAYTALLRIRYAESQQPFLDLLMGKSATLGCYCHDPSHCHRSLAAEILIKIATSKGIEIGWRGELVSKKVAT